MNTNQQYMSINIAATTKLVNAIELEDRIIKLAKDIAGDKPEHYTIEMLKNWKRKSTKGIVRKEMALEIAKSGLSFLSFDFAQTRIHSYMIEEFHTVEPAKEKVFKRSSIREKLDSYLKNQ
jgi:hypothetical protein